MCGIVGIMSLSGTARTLPDDAEFAAMTDVLAHRGPDARGIWRDNSRGVALGHRRLSIRDLSETGAQPMTSACGRFVIVYNGEVYSHREIARDLADAGRTFRGHSDTEVILEACALWGVERVLPRLIGMFAFALYDKTAGDLFVVRDRLGIKPLYWGEIGGRFVFGSELSALRRLPGWTPDLDRGALLSFMRHGYVPAPHTIYRGIQKLLPGSWLRVGRDGTRTAGRFWDLRAIASAAVTGRSQPQREAPLDDDTTIDRLESLIVDAVGRRLVADVPIGALLSGGLDSSLVAAVMAKTSSRRIGTYSIGFAETGFDEAPYARAVARHIGSEHVELYADPAHALALVERLPTLYDEPFADSSQLPTALVSVLTRQHVTVVLSGDGGDELFGGYSRYQRALQVWRTISRVPGAARQIAGRIPKSLVETVLRGLPRHLRRADLGARLAIAAAAGSRRDPGLLYAGMMSLWPEPEAAVIGGVEPKGLLWDASLATDTPDLLERMMLVDTLTYLPDDILTKVDRASMAVGLEVRVPLLDHRLVEFAWSLPPEMKLRDGSAKWALRQVLHRHVPRTLTDRPKMGFGVPLASWLRGPLRDWAEDLLDARRMESGGVFRAAAVGRRWRAHLAGEDYSYQLWTVLMAEAWLRANPDVTR